MRIVAAHHCAAASSSSFWATCARDGFVCVVPSAKSMVGTVWFPPFASSTTAAPFSISSMLTSA